VDLFLIPPFTLVSGSASAALVNAAGPCLCALACVGESCATIVIDIHYKITSFCRLLKSSAPVAIYKMF
jgi:hypothetical protein